MVTDLHGWVPIDRNILIPFPGLNVNNKEVKKRYDSLVKACGATPYSNPITLQNLTTVVNVATVIEIKEGKDKGKYWVVDGMEGITASIMYLSGKSLLYQTPPDPDTQESTMIKVDAFPCNIAEGFMVWEIVLRLGNKDGVLDSRRLGMNIVANVDGLFPYNMQKNYKEFEDEILKRFSNSFGGLTYGYLPIAKKLLNVKSIEYRTGCLPGGWSDPMYTDKVEYFIKFIYALDLLLSASSRPNAVQVSSGCSNNLRSFTDEFNHMYEQPKHAGLIALINDIQTVVNNNQQLPLDWEEFVEAIVDRAKLEKARSWKWLNGRGYF